MLLTEIGTKINTNKFDSFCSNDSAASATVAVTDKFVVLFMIVNGCFYPQKYV